MLFLLNIVKVDSMTPLLCYMVNCLRFQKQFWLMKNTAAPSRLLCRASIYSLSLAEYSADCIMLWRIRKHHKKASIKQIPMAKEKKIGAQE